MVKEDAAGAPTLYNRAAAGSDLLTSSGKTNPEQRLAPPPLRVLSSEPNGLGKGGLLGPAGIGPKPLTVCLTTRRGQAGSKQPAQKEKLSGVRCPERAFPCWRHPSYGSGVARPHCCKSELVNVSLNHTAITCGSGTSHRGFLSAPCALFL